MNLNAHLLNSNLQNTPNSQKANFQEPPKSVCVGSWEFTGCIFSAAC
jgi:hypothetical protein